MSFLATFGKLHPKPKATFECKFCEKSFSQPVYLKTHIRSHTGEKRYHCNDCDETFEQYRALVSHKKTHRSFTCELCGKSVASEARLNDHLKSHTGQKLECYTCKQLFTSVNLLGLHLQSHAKDTSPLHQSDGGGDDHNNNNNNNKNSSDGHGDAAMSTGDDVDPSNENVTFDNSLAISSTVDNSSYTAKSSKSSRSGGSNSSSNYNTECEVCHKKFSCASSLTKHMNIHTKKRSFQCNFCAKSFLHSFTLTRHLRIHTGEKPYKCNYCEQHFSDASTRNRHAKIHRGLLGNAISAITATALTTSVDSSLDAWSQPYYGDVYGFSGMDSELHSSGSEYSGRSRSRNQASHMASSGKANSNYSNSVQYPGSDTSHSTKLNSSSPSSPSSLLLPSLSSSVFPSFYSSLHSSTSNNNGNSNNTSTTVPSAVSAENSGSDANDDDMQPVLQILSANQDHCFIMNSDCSKEFDVMNDL